MISLAARSYARHVIPLTVLAVALFAPLAVFALELAVPRNESQAIQLLRLTWGIAGCAWIVHYLLVGAAVREVRGVAAGRPLSQLASLRTGIAGIVRAGLPVAVAIAGIILGGIALAVPGIVLVVLFAFTGASERPGLAAPLADSAAVARAHLGIAGPVAAGVVLVNLAIAAIAYLILIGTTTLTATASADELAAVRTFLQVVTIGVIGVSPIAAVLLAAVHVDRSKRRS